MAENEKGRKPVWKSSREGIFQIVEWDNKGELQAKVQVGVKDQKSGNWVNGYGTVAQIEECLREYRDHKKIG